MRKPLLSLQASRDESHSQHQPATGLSSPGRHQGTHSDPARLCLADSSPMVRAAAGMASRGIVCVDGNGRHDWAGVYCGIANQGGTSPQWIRSRDGMDGALKLAEQARRRSQMQHEMGRMGTGACRNASTRREESEEERRKTWLRDSRRTESEQQQLHENSTSTHLVVYFLRSIFQKDRLLKDIAHLGQLFALRPVVESACDEHFFGGMLPRSQKQPKRQLSSASHSVNP